MTTTVQMTTLDEKVIEHFRRDVIYKPLSRLSGGLGSRIPRFVADFLASQFASPEEPEVGMAKVREFLTQFWVESNAREVVKSRIRQNRQGDLFGHLTARMDADRYWVSVPALGDRFVRLHDSVFAEHGDTLLLAGGAWGKCTIAYDGTGTNGRNPHPFVLVKFVPMQVTKIDVDAWIAKRALFTDDEWVDLIITSVGMDPSQMDETTKAIYLIRLIPSIEPNVNMIELGPPASGKSYTYRCSAYTALISGADTTVAALFYNRQRDKVGLIGRNDLILFDEVTRAKFEHHKANDVITGLMQYMNEGRVTRDGINIAADCSIVMVGNIATDHEHREPEGFFEHLFKPLPAAFRDDDAFLDRIHGFVPGWQAPQIVADNYACGYGWMADYFSEIMHQMRGRSYIPIVRSRVTMKGMPQRSATAVEHLASGLLKLVYPHRTAETIRPEELKWVMDMAISLRQRVVNELAKISPGEFGGTVLAYGLV